MSDTPYMPADVDRLIAAIDAAVLKSELRKAESAAAGFLQGHARLISAAPTLERDRAVLLERLKECADLLDGMTLELAPNTLGRMALTRARAAIKQADGDKTKPSDTPLVNHLLDTATSYADLAFLGDLLDLARKLERDRAMLLGALRNTVWVIDSIVSGEGGDLKLAFLDTVSQEAKAAIKQVEGE